MDFSFTEEQTALRDVARRRLATPVPPSWRELHDLGWLDKDLDAVDTALLAEEAGRAHAPSEWLITQALAQDACHAAGRPLAQPTTLAWREPEPGPSRLDGPLDALACRAERAPGGAVRLYGIKTRVPYATGIEVVLVLARGADGPGLYRLPLAALEGEPRTLSGVDTGRPWLELDLAGVPAEPLLTGAATGALMRRIRHRALTLLACEAVGLARAALDSAVAHARSRSQFGRPIGAYQAVSHRLVDVYSDIELAASLAYVAAWRLNDTGDEDQTATAVAAATIAARDAALFACEAEVQTFGAAGFLWEHPATHRYRRARWISCFDGTTDEHRGALGTAVLDAPW
ncbi:acyl-CoA dehydrogenase family protein [Micromonospora sp. CPCC 206061]|uniref:acyl-CoA dehydrogenase family protein n=1 Tax=Micromonospora sp. CPCC 206061 TaxID=3122410 RepID=UPI002FEFC8A2